jgi:hypothetical protein
MAAAAAENKQWRYGGKREMAAAPKIFNGGNQLSERRSAMAKKAESWWRYRLA